MDYSMIGKIQKAKEYAEDPSRVTFDTLAVEFKGDNDTYTVSLSSEGWHCTCPGFQKYAICPHVMTLERLLEPMLKRPRLPYANGQNVVSDVDKSKRYAEDQEKRIRFLSFTASFKGNHNTFNVSYDNGKWDCDNPYFASRGVCSNTMALERILSGMVEPVTTMVIE
jgi:hypothetical protein